MSTFLHKAVVLIALFSTSVARGEISWINPDGGAWEEPSNWSGGQIPTSSDDVVLPDLGKLYVVEVVSTQFARSLVISDDSVTLWCRGGNQPFTQILVTGNMTNRGTIWMEAPTTAGNCGFGIGRMTNYGSVVARRGAGGNRDLAVSELTNFGTISTDTALAIGGDVSTAHGNHRNSGFISVDDPAGAITVAGENFTQVIGYLRVDMDRTFTLRECRLTFQNGVIDGTVKLVDSNLVLETTSPIDAVMQGIGSVSGRLSPVQQIKVLSRNSPPGFTTLGPALQLTNEGLITLTSEEQSGPALLNAVAGVPMTNTGTIRALRGAGGTRQITSSNLHNDGGLEVQARVDLTIVGDLVCGPSSRIGLEFGGAADGDYSTISVDQIACDGTLAVQWFVERPPVGTELPIIYAPEGGSGRFANRSGGGPPFRIEYRADSVVLVRANPVADLDGDSDVDLQDLAALLAGFGTASYAEVEQGDTDFDGDVDLSDLANLLAVFGS